MDIKDLLIKHSARLKVLRKTFNDANIRPGPKNYVATILVCLPLGPSRDFDEIIPRLILSNKQLALDMLRLQQLGVKHIVNAAMGKQLSQIDVDDSTFSPLGISYMGVVMRDVQGYNISQHFYPAADFIEMALQSEGKVLVFCQMGASRSASLVIAYLMIKHRLCLDEAIRAVLKKREIFPNDGFIARLCELDDQLFPVPSTQS